MIWWKRIFAAFYGVVETNAYLAMKHFAEYSNTHAEFRRILSDQLIHNTELFGDCGHNLRRCESAPQQTLHILVKFPGSGTRKSCYMCANARSEYSFVKTRWNCEKCGTDSGRRCFWNHISGGFPPHRKKRKTRS